MHLCFVSCQGKTIDTSKSDVMERESSVGLTDPPLVNKLNSTVVPVKTKQAYLPEHEGEHFSLVNTYTRTAGGKVWAASSITQVFFFSVVLSTWVLLKNFHVCTWEFQDFTLTRHVEMFALTSGSAWGHNLSLKAQPQDVLGATDIYDWVHISNHLLQQPERDTGKHWGTSLLSLSDSIQVATVQLRKKPELPLVQQWEPLICIFLLLPPDVSYNHSKKHHGNRGKVTGARLAGRSRDQHRTESS